MKLVKITVQGMPIVSTPVPYTMGTHGPLELTSDEIFKCLIGGAQVFEIMPDGRQIRLSLTNYDKDNTPPSLQVQEPIAPPVDAPSIADILNAQEPKEVDPAEEESPNDEELVEETKEEEGSKSPEHWQPPKQAPQQGKNKNNNNNRR